MLKNRAVPLLMFSLLTHHLGAHAANMDTNTTENETLPADQLANDGSAQTTAAEAKAGAVVIDGDKLELYLDKSMRASGDATISQNSKTIQGDTIHYDVQNDQLDVLGNATIHVGNTKITGPELKMGLSDEVGEMASASISLYKTSKPQAQGVSISSEDFSRSLGNLQNQQIGGDTSYSLDEAISTSQLAPTNDVDASSSSTIAARADAKNILFEGQNTKRLKEARYTTCEAGNNDWYIKAKDLEINDYTESGVAKNAYIEFKGMPILYTPWISFSFNNQRKSGFLAPTYGTTSKSGFELTLPFYWNIAPNMDATFGTRALSKRGVQLQGEFRYLEENFSGVDHLEYLPSDSLSGENRYYINLKHQQNLGSGWSAGYSLEKVSDDQYFSDLSTHIVTTSRINLAQQFTVDYADDIWRFSGLVQKYQTLDNLSYPYERLPQLTLTGNNDFGAFNANLYTQLVKFDTNVNAPTNVTGSRFTIYPSISLPINKSYGFIIPKVGISYTSYSLNDDPYKQSSASRTLPIVSLDGGLFFDRDFKIASRAYTQTIEPRIFYTYIPYSNQAKLPVFDSSLYDLNFSTLFNENQYTGNDRINNANQVSLSLTTRLIESKSGIQRLSASIGQRYYFADQKVALPGETLNTSNSSDIIAGFTTNLKTKWNLDTFWQYNTDNSQSARTTITSRYNPEPGKTLNLSYSYRRDSIEQVNASAQWPLKNGWYGVGRINYSLRDKQLIETIAGLEYDAGCWQARTLVQRVETATANANYAFFFQLELGGLASIGNNPLTVIKRSVPGYVRSGLIPETSQQSYYE
jgi:LPS-assembly protein